MSRACEFCRFFRSRCKGYYITHHLEPQPRVRGRSQVARTRKKYVNQNSISRPLATARAAPTRQILRKLQPATPQTQNDRALTPLPPPPPQSPRSPTQTPCTGRVDIPSVFVPDPSIDTVDRAQGYQGATHCPSPPSARVQNSLGCWLMWDGIPCRRLTRMGWLVSCGIEYQGALSASWIPVRSARVPASATTDQSNTTAGTVVTNTVGEKEGRRCLR